MQEMANKMTSNYCKHPAYFTLYVNSTVRSEWIVVITMMKYRMYLHRWLWFKFLI